MYHNNYTILQKYNKFGIESVKYYIFLDLLIKFQIQNRIIFKKILPLQHHLMRKVLLKICHAFINVFL